MSDLKRADDLLIGGLVQSVETLTTEVALLKTSVQGLHDRMNVGKGIFYGAIVAAGGSGAVLAQLVGKFFQ